jgi:hypothetical protein
MQFDESRASDQGAIWREIDAKSARLGSHSATSAAAAMYESRRRSLDDLVESLKAATDQVGAVFAIGGKIAGLDVFDSSATWQKLSPKLVRSYGLDALDPMIAEAKSTQLEPAQFLDAVRTARAQSFPAVGAGTDIRFDSGDVVGAALANDRGAVHVVAFPSQPHEQLTSRARRRTPPIA